MGTRWTEQYSSGARRTSCEGYNWGDGLQGGLRRGVETGREEMKERSMS